MSNKNIERHLKSIAKLLEGWQGYTVPARYDRSSVRGAQTVEQIRARFEPCRFKQLCTATFETKGDLRDYGFITPQPVPTGAPVLFPVVLPLVGVESGSLLFSLRIGVIGVSETGDVSSDEGWRFEMGDRYHGLEEASFAGHYGHHCQRSTGWNKDGPHGFTHEAWIECQGGVTRTSAAKINESRPAFPLACRSPVGLAVAAISALYGSKVAWEIADGAQLAPKESEEALEIVIGRTNSA